MRGKFVFHADDGTQEDVTEGVQALYDLVIGSMDWGSGFWSYEDALPVANIAQLAGFDQCGEAERYVKEALFEKESAEWKAKQPPSTRYTDAAYQPLSHDHVFSVSGKCMWPRCGAKNYE
jgi:hypothetical protein